MNEPHRSHVELRVLQALRCIGVAGTERLVVASDVSPSDCAAALVRLSASGLIAQSPGPFGGWSLTGDGRAVGQRWLFEELDRAGAREAVFGCYESFLGLNSTLLAICTDWQMCKVGDTYVANDHADPDYDARVLSRLIGIDGAAQGICAALAGRISRFDMYGRRLELALDKAMGGEPGYVADTLDSYHSVWFQLHEDLLTTLGISREAERRAGGGDA